MNDFVNIVGKITQYKDEPAVIDQPSDVSIVD